MGWEDEVGTAGDWVIAQRHGVPIHWVRTEREKRGIPALAAMASRDWARVEDLGKAPDPIVAQRLGCSVQAVRMARWRLGVPPYVGGGGS